MMMLFSRTPLSLLTFLAIGMTLSDAQDCAAETQALLSSPNVATAYKQMNQEIVSSLATCLTDGNDNCAVNVDSSGVEEACTSEGGKFSTPELDVSCTNSNTGLATIIEYDYVLCVGENCTEGQDDFDNAVNDALDNITDAIDDVAPDGVQCAAELLPSGAANMSVAFVMMALVTVVSYSFF